MIFVNTSEKSKAISHRIFQRKGFQESKKFPIILRALPITISQEPKVEKGLSQNDLYLWHDLKSGL